MGTLGTLAYANFTMNLSESVCRSTENRFVRTNSRFSVESNEFCDSDPILLPLSQVFSLRNPSNHSRFDLHLHK